MAGEITLAKCRSAGNMVMQRHHRHHCLPRECVGELSVLNNCAATGKQGSSGFQLMKSHFRCSASQWWAGAKTTRSEELVACYKLNEKKSNKKLFDPWQRNLSNFLVLTKASSILRTVWASFTLLTSSKTWSAQEEGINGPSSANKGK